MWGLPLMLVIMAFLLALLLVGAVMVFVFGVIRTVIALLCAIYEKIFYGKPIVKGLINQMERKTQ